MPHPSGAAKRNSLSAHVEAARKPPGPKKSLLAVAMWAVHCRLRARSHHRLRGVRGKLDAMRIVVCVKHVPDADSDRRIEGGRLVRGEDDILNELDENAIEAAVSLVEEFGGEVIAVSMGPEEAQDALTRSLQLGASRAVLVSDEALAGADAPGTAQILAGVIAALAEEAPVDLVFTAMASLDGMTSMVAPGIARVLDWPLLDLADSLEVDCTGDSLDLTITRHADGHTEVLRAAAPAVVSVTDQINEPRYPSFKELRAARSKPLDTWGDAELRAAGIDPTVATVNATEVVSASPRERAGGVIVTDSGEGGLALARFLAEKIGKTGK